MPDCQMCWNDWQTLQTTPFPAVDPAVEVCRNCGRSMKQVIAFIRSKGFELATVSRESGELVSSFPSQAGPKLSGPEAGVQSGQDQRVSSEEEPPSPPAKGARKAR